MPYQFQFRPYQRSFKQPLKTNHGSWDIREGIILRLSDETGAGWGEIAPISWFGSETWEQALDFCSQLPNEITAETIFSIPARLPACQFGFESAWEGLKKGIGGWGYGGIGRWGDGERTGTNFLSHPLTPSPPHAAPIPICGLLAAGEVALQQWQTLWNQGYRTFKWKIGVAPIAEELKTFHQLTQQLPAVAQVRLDANGGLNWQDAKEWLEVCDQAGIEFLEQPLPVEQFDDMLELSALYSTQLALDESVATIDQLKAAYQQGWQDIFVIKPCIAGSPKRLRQFCSEHEIDAVFSSVFETAIGRQAALRLADELACHNRAVGFGVNDWFDVNDDWFEQLWNY